MNSPKKETPSLGLGVSGAVLSDGGPGLSCNQDSNLDSSILSASTPDVNSFVGRHGVSNTSYTDPDAPLPPSSNTGGKVGNRRGVEVHGIDKSKGYVLIDWCAGTFPPSPDRGPVSELRETLKRSVIPGHHVELVELGRGWLGYEESWEIQVLTGAGTAKAGKIGAGGNGGKCHFSLTGEGCALIEDWSPLQYLLHFNKGYLTRVDIALDDHEGRRTLQEMRERYEVGEFGCGGRRPAIQSITNSDQKGDTLNIGSRAGGKLIRCYEKGKQLGNPNSDWLRVEVELHRKDRILPLDILSRPADFLAGAVPWVANLYQLAAERIKTVKEKAKLTLTKFLSNLRQQAGKAIGWMQRVGIKPEKIVHQIAQDDGTPKRLSLAGISDALLEMRLIDSRQAERLADGCATACPF